MIIVNSIVNLVLQRPLTDIEGCQVYFYESVSQQTPCYVNLRYSEFTLPQLIAALVSGEETAVGNNH